MKLLRTIQKFEALRFAAVLFAVGLLFTVISGAIVLKPGKQYEKVDAVITAIVTVDEDTTVTVHYQVNGVSYESQLDSYNSSWAVGDTVSCQYDPADPSQIHSPGGKLLAFAFLIIGIGAMGLGAVRFSRTWRGIAEPEAPASDATAAKALSLSDEEEESYVFHFTGKLNQDFVMKDRNRQPVFEAVCGHVTLLKDTPYTFRDLLTGISEEKMIGHTITHSVGTEFSFRVPITSAFTIDGTSNWDLLARDGYSFRFSLHGLVSRFDVCRYGVNIGSIETAGTEVMDKKYENNPLGKVPTNGIYRISCRPSEAKAMFLLCFSITRTDLLGTPVQ